MLGLNIYAMTAAVLLLSIIGTWVGVYLGQFGLRRVGNSAGVLVGLILIFVGRYELFF